jgi:uncharacterized protein
MAAVLLIAVCNLLGTICAVVFCLPFVLATIALIRRKLQQHNDEQQVVHSALYAGRVWHTRFLPVRHAFSYPLFIFCLDLDETDELFSTALWPLSLIATFRAADHLKNGEGLLKQATTKKEAATAKDEPPHQSLADRVLRLVAEKTKGSFAPTADTHRILLVTHLTYYGYCFNPVSFYYVKDRRTDEIGAVVGEVSNTPWNEMYCYVLHPDSIDNVKMDETTKTANKLHYVFPKMFHVSPFMEMHYDYDWTFWNFLTDKPSSENSGIQVINNLRQQNGAAARVVMQFSAKMLVERYSMHPYRIAFHMATFPMYCVLIQLWIHYEAFRLVVKGVAFQPHPTGSETTASRIIGHMMGPYFAAQEWWDRRKAKRKAS